MPKGTHACFDHELGLVILICRRIWQARNDAIFNHKLVSPQFLYAQALQLQQDFLEKQPQSSYSANRPTAQVRWTRPSFHFLKLNVDGAVNDVLGLRGLGAVLRNENGDLLIAVSKGMKGGFSVKATELYAAVLGFQTIIQAGFQSTQIILEMDALGVINDLNAADINWSIEGALVEEVRNLFRFFSSVICTYSPRKCNQAAHTLAKNALLFPAFQVWVEEGPQWLSRVLISDAEAWDLVTVLRIPIELHFSMPEVESDSTILISNLLKSAETELHPLDES